MAQHCWVKQIWLNELKLRRYRENCLLLIAAQDTKCKTCEQPECSEATDKANKASAHSVSHFTSKIGILQHMTWMNLENIILNETSQLQREKP